MHGLSPPLMGTLRPVRCRLPGELRPPTPASCSAHEAALPVTPSLLWEGRGVSYLGKIKTTCSGYTKKALVRDGWVDKIRLCRSFKVVSAGGRMPLIDADFLPQHMHPAATMGLFVSFALPSDPERFVPVQKYSANNGCPPQPWPTLANSTLCPPRAPPAHRQRAARPGHKGHAWAPQRPISARGGQPEQSHAFSVRLPHDLYSTGQHSPQRLLPPFKLEALSSYRALYVVWTRQFKAARCRTGRPPVFIRCSGAQCSGGSPVPSREPQACFLQAPPGFPREAQAGRSSTCVQSGPSRATQLAASTEPPAPTRTDQGFWPRTELAAASF